MTFKRALSELADADEDLPDVVRTMLLMATLANMTAQSTARDLAIMIAAELLTSRGPHRSENRRG